MMYKKPLIKVLNENTKVKSGKSLTWLNVEINGYGLIKLNCPAISDWKQILIWVKGYKTITIVVPINTTLEIRCWYFFGMEKVAFNVSDANWIIDTPKSNLNKDGLKLPILKIKFKKLNNFNNDLSSGIYVKNEIKNDFIEFISTQQMISSKFLNGKFKLDFLYKQKILNISRLYKRGKK